MTLAPQVLSVVRADTQAMTGVSLKLHVPLDLKYFEGHFAACALLPGVVQIAWAVEFAKLHLGLAAGITGMSAVKFTRPILPRANVDLKLQWAPNDRQLRFAYRSQAAECSAGTLLLA